MLRPLPGSKLFGFPGWSDLPDYPECDCRRKMSHLVTIHSREVGWWSEWYLIYDPAFQNQDKHPPVRPMGLSQNTSGEIEWVMVFYCPADPRHPVQTITQRVSEPQS